LQKHFCNFYSRFGISIKFSIFDIEFFSFIKVILALFALFGFAPALLRISLYTIREKNFLTFIFNVSAFLYILGTYTHLQIPSRSSRTFTYSLHYVCTITSLSACLPFILYKKYCVKIMRLVSV
jgi:hypothetical protein